MRRYSWIAIALLLVASCASEKPGSESPRKVAAERFMRAVYGGDLSVVDELAAADVVISYPVFQERFDTPALRGIDAAREFATGFSQRWTDTHITVHEAVADGDRVVLVWSFSGRYVGSVESDQPASNPGLQSWGGITFYRFDADGKIAVEVGEESEPGPQERLSG